jgi:hypothetical protein
VYVKHNLALRRSQLKPGYLKYSSEPAVLPVPDINNNNLNDNYVDDAQELEYGDEGLGAMIDDILEIEY